MKKPQDLENYEKTINALKETILDFKNAPMDKEKKRQILTDFQYVHDTLKKNEVPKLNEHSSFVISYLIQAINDEEDKDILRSIGVEQEIIDQLTQEKQHIIELLKEYFFIELDKDTNLVTIAHKN